MEKLIIITLFLTTLFISSGCGDNKADDYGISFDSKRAKELMGKYNSETITPEEVNEMLELGSDFEFQVGDFFIIAAENVESPEEYWNIMEKAQNKLKTGTELMEFILKHSMSVASKNNVEEFIRGYDFYRLKMDEADDLLRERFGEDIY